MSYFAEIPTRGCRKCSPIGSANETECESNAEVTIQLAYPIWRKFCATSAEFVTQRKVIFNRFRRLVSRHLLNSCKVGYVCLIKQNTKDGITGIPYMELIKLSNSGKTRPLEACLVDIFVVNFSVLKLKFIVTNDAMTNLYIKLCPPLCLSLSHVLQVTLCQISSNRCSGLRFKR